LAGGSASDLVSRFLLLSPARAAVRPFDGAVQPRIDEKLDEKKAAPAELR
jgi:hypothetical protein